MCDCYDEKCNYPGCNNRMSVHISDFCIPREEVGVFCRKHIPEDHNVFVFTAQKNDHYHKIKRGWKMGVVITGKIPRGYGYDGKLDEPVSPNYGIDFNVQTIKARGKK